MFDFIYIYSFIPTSGCVGYGPQYTAYNAVKTALNICDSMDIAY